MTHLSRCLLIGWLGLAFLPVRSGGAGGASPVSSQMQPARLLVFSKTAAFRHDSIPAAIAALRGLGQEHHVAIDFTEDSTVFAISNLARYAAVVFLLTTGTVLDTDQATALESYIHSGGGYVGIHSASDTEYTWPWYGQLVGAYFDRVHGHSKVVSATVHVVDAQTPSTSMLPATWIRTDEWYNFAPNPTGSVDVLLTVHEATYHGRRMGAHHPLAWYHPYDGGRAWYTAMGHTAKSYAQPLFLAHIWGGMVYAAGGKLG